MSLYFSTSNPVYRTSSNPIQQSGRRQLPTLPQQNQNMGHCSETALRYTLSANDHVDRYGNFHQEVPEMNLSTSGRTTPTIILDNSASAEQGHQSRFVGLV